MEAADWAILVRGSSARLPSYLVVPEIGVLKWLLEIRKNGSVNLEINGRF